MYRELATSTRPLSAQDLADRLGVHANTVRLHLERLREVGLVDVEAVHRGTVGRPAAPLLPRRRRTRRSASTRPPTRCSPGCSRALAERVGADPDDAADTGHAWGAEVGRRTRSRSCLRALEQELDRLGFEPAAGPGDGTVRGRRADRVPPLPVPRARRGVPRARVQPPPRVCAKASSNQVGGGRVEEFATLYDPEPCHVTVAVGSILS